MTQFDGLQSFMSEITSAIVQTGQTSANFAEVRTRNGRYVVFGFFCATALDEPVTFTLQARQLGAGESYSDVTGVQVTIQNAKDIARFFIIDSNALPPRTNRLRVRAELVGAGPVTVACWFSQTDDYPRQMGDFDPTRIIRLLTGGEVEAEPLPPEPPAEAWVPMIIRSEAEYLAGDIGGGENQIMQCGARHADDPNIVVFAHDCAHVWISRNNGATYYHPPNAGLPHPNSECIEIDPMDPNRMLIYKTAGFNPNNAGMMGIYLTVDGGMTWDLAKAFTTLDTTRYTHKIAYDSTSVSGGHAQTWYCAETDGDTINRIYKSTDGGVSFTQVASGFVASTLFGIWHHPTVSGTLLMAMSSGVYKSVDGGASWNTTGMTLNTRSIAWDHVTPTTVYCVHKGTGDLYKSTNTGTTWSLLKSDWAANLVFVNPAYPGSIWLTPGLEQANTVRCIYSDDFGDTWSPDNGTTTVSPGLDRDNTFEKRMNTDYTFLLPDPLDAGGCILSAGARLWKCVAGTVSAVTFVEETDMKTGAQHQSVGGVSVDVGNTNRHHQYNVDKGCIETTNNGDWFVERIGGVVALVSAGKLTGAGYAFKLGSIRPASGANLLVAAVGRPENDQSRMIYSVDSGINWALSVLDAGGGDPVLQADLHPFYGSLSMIWDGLYYSDNFGATVKPIVWGGVAGSEPQVFGVCRDVPTTVWALSADRKTVVRSTDNGANWASYRVFTTGLKATSHAIFTPHPSDPALFYGRYPSTGDIALYGAESTQVMGIPEHVTGLRGGQVAYAQALEFDPNDYNVLYASIYGWGCTVILRSLDGGTTWEDITLNYPRIISYGVNIMPSGEVMASGCCGSWLFPPPYAATTALYDKNRVLFDLYYPAATIPG